MVQTNSCSNITLMITSSAQRSRAPTPPPAPPTKETHTVPSHSPVPHCRSYGNPYPRRVPHDPIADKPLQHRRRVETTVYARSGDRRRDGLPSRPLNTRKLVPRASSVATVPTAEGPPPTTLSSSRRLDDTDTLATGDAYRRQVLNSAACRVLRRQDRIGRILEDGQRLTVRTAGW